VMRLDTGVPVLHRGVAAGAIPRAMVDIDTMYLICYQHGALLLLLRGENCVNCEGCL